MKRQLPNSLIFNYHDMRIWSFLLFFTFSLFFLISPLAGYSNQEDSLLQALDYQKDTSRISTLNELSTYYMSEDLEKAVFMAQLALKESLQIKFKSGALLSHRKLGDAYRKLAKFDSAQFHLYEALKLAKTTGSALQELRVSIGIGNLYTNTENYTKALDIYEKSKLIALQLNDSNNYTTLCINSGICYENLDENQKAISSYLQGIKYSSDDKINYPNLLLNMGSAYFYSEQIDSAFYYNKWAKTVFLKNQNESGFADALLNEGIYNEEIGEIEKALDSYHKGYSYFQNTTNYAQQKLFTQSLMLAFGELQLVDSMYHYYYVSEDINSIYTQSITKKAIHEISIKYEVEKKEQNLKLVQHEKEKVELANSLQKNTIYILLAVIVIIALIVFITYKQHQEKQRLSALEVAAKNQEIENLIKDQEIKTYSAQIEGIEKERKRVAQDLHDQIGGILATIKLQFEGTENLNNQNLATVKSLINESIRSVRSISHNLADGRIDELGLIQSIENLKSSLVDSGKMHFDLYLENYKASCSPDQEREIFKIILELLSNTLKHAEADHIVLQINDIDQIIHLTFEDNGKGFNPQNAKNGLGMRTISQRVSTLKGNWHVDSSLNHGSTIVIEIPLG